jgi:hypothetical protein
MGCYNDTCTRLYEGLNAVDDLPNARMKFKIATLSRDVCINTEKDLLVVEISQVSEGLHS